jgi:homocysteine S-methyltransferase
VSRLDGVGGRRPVPFELGEPFTVVDGGLSTALEQLGHRSTGLLWTAQLVLDDPDVLIEAHRLFVDAGAEVVITSSYQASVAGFERAGVDRARAVAGLRSTTDLARRAGAPVVAASVGPFGATLGDGSEYHGRYDAGWTEIRRFHRERLQILVDTGPDLLAIETIPGRVEAEIVLEEVERCSDLAAWLTMSCRGDGTTCAGERFDDAVAAIEGSSSLVAIGINCTAPEAVSELLESARSVTALPFVVYPNHGAQWDPDGECWLGDGDDQFDRHLPAWLALGTRLIGGCCGVGPASVAQLVRLRSALGSQT